MSVEQFEDLTPYELDKALRDHSEYHFAHTKQLMNLNRFVGVVLRNKGLKMGDQIRRPENFYRFYWEELKPIEKPTQEEWAAMDRKYAKPTK